MFMVDGFGWVGLLFALALPVLLVRDVIRLIKKQIRKRESALWKQERDAFWAEEKRKREEDETFYNEIQEQLRQMEDRRRLILDLETAIEAAPNKEERIAARERLLAELRSPHR